MSRSIDRIVRSAEQDDPRSARWILGGIAKEMQDKPLYYKGIDIAQKTLAHLNGELPLDELEPPIFSLGLDHGEWLGFASVFDVESYQDMPTSKILPAGFSVETETVINRYDLTEREVSFMIGRLPAVRIYFISSETT